MAREHQANLNLNPRADAETGSTLTTFHHFPRLPPELRLMVWESAFPEITLESRVFELEIEEPYPSETDEDELEDSSVPMYVYFIQESRSLNQQTLPFRTLGAINHETQSLVLRGLPDDFEFYSSSTTVYVGRLRFRKETDIIFFDGEPHVPDYEAEIDIDCGFKDKVQNVSFNFKCGPEPVGWFLWLLELPHLRRFYYGSSHMAQDCQEEHKRLSNLMGCLQHGIFRYPTIEMVRDGPESHFWNGLGFVLEVAEDREFDLLPLLKMSPGLYSSCLEWE